MKKIGCSKYHEKTGDWVGVQGKSPRLGNSRGRVEDSKGFG